MKTEIVDIVEIQEIIIAYANGDFSRRIKSNEERDERDTITAGINMLGEELEQTMISRDYFGSIYNAVSDILIVTDNEFIIRDANQTAETKFGLSKENLIGTDSRKLIKQEASDVELIIKEFNELQRKNFIGEIVLSNSISKDFIASCSVSKIVDRFAQVKGYLIIATDITEKKKQEQDLLKLVVSTQEEERRRLATDLHDSLGQELNAIKMYLNTLDYMDKADPTYGAVHEECKLMLDQSISNVQNLAYDLMPKSLEKVNLSYALNELCNKLGSLCEIHHNFDGKKLKLDKNTEIIIYRIFQEFITNSMKHAKGSVIQLSIKKSKEIIKFSLRDNGPGFDSARIGRGNGVQNIKSRLEVIRAKYHFEGKKGVGTILEFNLENEIN